jgi:5'-methylthioadenosine phosphorylase
VAKAEVGVFGGSGFYSFLEDVEEIEVETPYGKPSAKLTVGEIGGKQVAFLPRHGSDHQLPPHEIPYRANVWAMRELGVRRLIGPNASGALKADLELGEFVVCDQFVDRTSGRVDTFYDGPETTHVSAADPYCPELRRLLVDTAAELGIKVRDGGTVVVIQGPRFSTRAESKWFQAMGWDTINMTAYPEGYLARELELCYANISMVTDHDVGVDGARLARAGGLRLQREQREASGAALRGDPPDRPAFRGPSLHDGAHRGASVIELRGPRSGINCRISHSLATS